MSNWPNPLRTLYSPFAAVVLRGLLAPIKRKNGWQLAEVVEHRSPAGIHNFLLRTHWDADTVRDTCAPTSSTISAASSRLRRRLETQRLGYVLAVTGAQRLGGQVEQCSGRLVIGSRNAPNLGLGRLRLSHQPLKIGPEQLRFSLDETVELFRSRQQLSLSDDEIRLLHHYTVRIAGESIAHEFSITGQIYSVDDGFYAHVPATAGMTALMAGAQSASQAA